MAKRGERLGQNFHSFQCRNTRQSWRIIFGLCNRTQVVCLTLESKFVRHSAGNVLLVLSDLLVESASKWEEFLHFVWVGLEAAISNIHSPSLASLLPTSTLRSDCNDPSFNSLLRSRIRKANWVTVTELLRVLRNLLKSLKQDSEEVVKIYMHAVNVSLSSACWDWLSETPTSQTCEMYPVRPSSEILHETFGSLESQIDVALGMLLQLFSSLVDKIGLEDESGSSMNELYILTRLSCFVPKLLHWCHSKHRSYDNIFISRYLRHKVMMLMIRLSFYAHQLCANLVLWLELLWKYFEDILYRPLSEPHVRLGDFLEESPFLASMENREQLHDLSTRHLQRQAIFLLFKCSFRLISLDNETSGKCACATAISCLSSKQQFSNGFYSGQGLSELAKWLQKHITLTMFAHHETYLKECSRFALSFLQLYIDEDDLLFEMLLLLLSSPIPAWPLHYNGNGKSCEEGKEDISFHLSCIFNPIHLFHLFLDELHYDHSVLLDYLISKDTGIQCITYLLRCLRIVCNSWHIFVEFSTHRGELSQSSHKKRKVYIGGDCSFGKPELSPLSMKGINSSKVLERRTMTKKQKIGYMITPSKQWDFENAKECLLSLKKSVENLHQKNLFPYNPTALLKSLTRFEEHCKE